MKRFRAVVLDKRVRRIESLVLFKRLPLRDAAITAKVAEPEGELPGEL